MGKKHCGDITGTQGYWIKFKMKLNDITRYDITVQAGCSPQMVSQFLGGRKNSERVKAAIIRILGRECLEGIFSYGVMEE
jgi:hypothetical protein